MEELTVGTSKISGAAYFVQWESFSQPVPQNQWQNLTGFSTRGLCLILQALGKHREQCLEQS